MISADTFRRHSAPVPTRAGIPYSPRKGALGLSPTGAGGLHWGSHDSTVATPFRLLNHSYIRSCPYTQGVRCRREQSVANVSLLYAVCLVAACTKTHAASVRP